MIRQAGQYDRLPYFFLTQTPGSPAVTTVYMLALHQHRTRTGLKAARPQGMRCGERQAMIETCSGIRHA